MTNWYENSVKALQLNGKGERTQQSYTRTVRMLTEFYGKTPVRSPRPGPHRIGGLVVHAAFGNSKGKGSLVAESVPARKVLQTPFRGKLKKREIGSASPSLVWSKRRQKISVSAVRMLDIKISGFQFRKHPNC